MRTIVTNEDFSIFLGNLMEGMLSFIICDNHKDKKDTKKYSQLVAHKDELSKNVNEAYYHILSEDTFDTNIVESEVSDGIMNVLNVFTVNKTIILLHKLVFPDGGYKELFVNKINKSEFMVMMDYIKEF